jgi:hypothetical protein
VSEEDKPGDVWGYTKKDWDRYDPKNEKIPLPHLFRNQWRLCPGKTGDGRVRKQHGYLFIPLKNFDSRNDECCRNASNYYLWDNH